MSIPGMFILTPETANSLEFSNFHYCLKIEIENLQNRSQIYFTCGCALVKHHTTVTKKYQLELSQSDRSHDTHTPDSFGFKFGTKPLPQQKILNRNAVLFRNNL